MINVKKLAEQAAELCDMRGWDKSWSPGGCYLHLEVSEFIEALRGKGNPEEEAADVFLTFLSMVWYNDVDIDKVEEWLEIKMQQIEEKTCGDL